MKCPDCGSGRRSDGYHREGWYWLECDRRYNPDLDEYSPENNWCRLKQLEAKFEELHTACLEYLKSPPTNAPARRKFAEIVTGGSCDHLDDDIVTEQHECWWVIRVELRGKIIAECNDPLCPGELDFLQISRRLNKYETLKKATDALKPAWVCEFCFSCLLEGDLPADWGLVFLSAICPSCQKKVAEDGGYHSVPGGSYSDGRKDPRAYADIRKGKND